MKVWVGHILTNLYEVGVVKVDGNIFDHIMPNNTIGRFVKIQVYLRFFTLCGVEVYSSLGMFLACVLFSIYYF